MSVDAPTTSNDSMEYANNYSGELLHYQQPYPLATTYALDSNHASQDSWNTSPPSTEHATIAPYVSLDHSPSQWTGDGLEDQHYWSYPPQWSTVPAPQMIPIPYSPWPEHKPSLPTQPVTIPEMVQIPEASGNVILPQRGRGRAPWSSHSRNRHSTLGDSIENVPGEYTASRAAHSRRNRTAQEDAYVENASSPRSASSAAASSTRARSTDPTKRSTRGFTPVIQRERPFPCQRCPARFSRKRDRDRHERSIHTGSTPYICAGCNEGFVRSDARGRHWRTAPQCQRIHKSHEAQTQDRSPSQ